MHKQYGNKLEYELYQIEEKIKNESSIYNEKYDEAFKNKVQIEINKRLDRKEEVNLKQQEYRKQEEYNKYLELKKKFEGAW